MLKYLGIGLLFSGLLMTEASVNAVAGPVRLFPDPALLIIVVVGIRGGIRQMPALCLVMGFVQGGQGPAPAGFYILAYLFISAFLHHTGSFFFTEHPLTQLFLALLMVGVYGLFFAAGQMLHLWPEITRAGTLQGIYAGLLTAVLVPVALAIGRRFRPARRRLSL